MVAPRSGLLGYCQGCAGDRLAMGALRRFGARLVPACAGMTEGARG